MTPRKKKHYIFMRPTAYIYLLIRFHPMQRSSYAPIFVMLCCVWLHTVLFACELQAAQPKLAQQSKTRAAAPTPVKKLDKKAPAPAQKAVVAKAAAQIEAKAAGKPQMLTQASKQGGKQPAKAAASAANAKPSRSAPPVAAQKKVTAAKVEAVAKAIRGKAQQPPAKKAKNIDEVLAQRRAALAEQERKERLAAAARKSSIRTRPLRTETVNPPPAPTAPPISCVEEVPTPPNSYFGGMDMDKDLSSKTYVVMDSDNGEILLAKNPDLPRQPASTIKIITGMIALKSLRDDDEVNVSKYAAGMPCSKVFLSPKKSYEANDLINSVLLASANDASVALAERIAGTESRFAKVMTFSAQMWGAKNTICRTASGLTAQGQQTTARDLATLFRFAMQHEAFAERMQERKLRTRFGKTLVNHNKALWRIDGAVGGKTGFTNAAGQTYVGQFSRQGANIVVALMGSYSMWSDLDKLVNYGFEKKKQELLGLHQAK